MFFAFRDLQITYTS